MSANVDNLLAEIKRVQKKVIVAGRMKHGTPREALLATYNTQIKKHAARIIAMGGDLVSLGMRPRRTPKKKGTTPPPPQRKR